MSDLQPPLIEDRFVFFVDFLGFSDAVKGWDEKKAPALLQLLRRLAASQSSHSIEGAPEADGSYKIKISPELTTFSDLVVVSYRMAALDEVEAHIQTQLDSLWIDMILQEVQRLTGAIARHALEIGLLVRGGLSFGELYHEGPVVIGKAMIDAYQLESHVAGYPRIVVDPRLYARIPETSRITRLLSDTDGMLHVNYFEEMLLRAGPDAASWLHSSLQKIDDNIEAHRAGVRFGPLAKWTWLRRQLAEAGASFSA